MPALLVHGALLGAVFVGFAGLAEFLLALRAFPYHHDFGLWLGLLPQHLLAGAVLGALVAAALPLLSRRKDREAYPGLFLACGLVAAGAAVVALIVLHFHTLVGVRFTDPRALLWTAVILAGGLGLHLALGLVARSRLGWMVASFFTPLSCLAGLALLAALAWIGWMMPVGAAPLGATATGLPPASAPNVLLVVLDTVAADHLGCYGYSRNTSEELDRIAREGVLCEQAFAATNWTLPSHASIFTGLHPTTHGTGWEHPRLADGRARVEGKALADFRTLAEELGSRGWETCGVAQKAWISADTGLTQGFSRFWDYSRPLLAERLFLPETLGMLGRALGRQPEPEIDKGAERIVDRSLKWLGGGRGRDPERPFFLFLNLNEAHDPFQPPEELQRSFLPEGIPIEDYQQLPQDPPFRKEFICGARSFRPHEPEILQAMYDAEILYQDRQLGRLFEGLRELDLMEETLVIVTADHGEEFGEHGVLGHQLLLTDGMLHVPLILRYPTRLPAGTRFKGLFSLVDVFPTVIELVEAETGSHWAPDAHLQALEGTGFLQAFAGEAPPPRDFVMAHYDNCTPHLKSYPCWGEEDNPLWKHAHAITCIRTEEWKATAGGDGDLEAVSLLQDPAETGEPPWSAEEQPEPLELIRRMRELLNCYEQRRLILLDPMATWRGMAATPTTSRGQVVDLEQTGYVGEESEADPEQRFLPPCEPKLR